MIFAVFNDFLNDVFMLFDECFVFLMIFDDWLMLFLSFADLNFLIF